MPQKTTIKKNKAQLLKIAESIQSRRVETESELVLIQTEVNEVLLRVMCAIH